MVFVYILIGVVIAITVIAIANYSEQNALKERKQSELSWLEVQNNQLRGRINQLEALPLQTSKNGAELLVLNEATIKKNYNLEDLADLTKNLHQLYQKEYPAKQLNYKMNYGEHIKIQFSPVTFANLGVCINELMHNVITHANSNFCFNIFTRENREIQLITHDNGIGFNSEKARENQHGGLNRVQQLTKNINASFQVSSVAGVGTKCLIKLKSSRIGF